MNPPWRATPGKARQPESVFINYSENDRDAKKHLSLINAHCSAFAHRRRRNARLQNTTTVPRPLPWTRASKNERELLRRSRLAVVDEDPRQQDKREKKLNDDSRVESQAASDFHETRLFSEVHLPTALQPKRLQKKPVAGENFVLRPFKGNSDPFNVFSVPLTPEVVRVLSFTQTGGLPGIFMSKFYQLLSGVTRTEPSLAILDPALISYNASQRLWQANIHGLADNCYTLAWLSTWVGMSARAAPTSWAARISLSLRVQAVSALRHKLLNSAQGDAVLSDCFHTLSDVFTGECLADNVPAARIHAAVLRRILESGHHHFQAVIEMLYDDVDLAVRHNHRTFLDVEGWCITTFSPYLTQLAQMLPLPLIQESSLHPAVTYPPLRNIWRWYREMFETMKGGPYWNARWAQNSLRDKAYIYFTANSMINHGRLHNMYLDLREGVVMQGASSKEILTQAALVLAVMCIAGRIGAEVVINNVDIRDASVQLLSRLWECLEIAIMISGEEGQIVQFAEAHLWLAYIGAMEEVRCTQRRLSGIYHLTVATSFTELLRTLCEESGVRNWTQMKELAESYLYGSFLEPDGEEVFEKLLYDKHPI